MGSKADWFRGLMAGAKLGPILYAVELGLSLLYTEVYLMRLLGYETRFTGIGNLVLYLVGDLIILMVVTIVIGVLFAMFEERLPGPTVHAKAMALFAPLWALYTVTTALVLAGSFELTFPGYEAFVLVLVLMSIPYAYLLGFLWEVQGPTDW